LLANQQIESCSYQNTPDSNVQLGTFARGRDVYDLNGSSIAWLT